MDAGLGARRLRHPWLLLGVRSALLLKDLARLVIRRIGASAIYWGL